MARYWIAVASREHVMHGVTGGFAQVCHGKRGPLKLMTAGDWIVYYSPVEQFGEKAPCRRFTAIGKIDTGNAYEFQMSKDFVPWRIDVTFVSPENAKEVAIEPLIDKLSFIQNKQRWGFPFRRGCFPVPLSDFQIIANSMGVTIL